MPAPLSLVHRFGQVGSTLDLLHELAAAGAPEGTAIVAEEQLLGRGSRGTTWHSPPGGLWFSLLVRPASPFAVEVLSLRVGLRVADLLEGLGGLPEPGLKWPNDLLLGGRKLGGILCEARWQGGWPVWVAVGIGMNVANPIPSALGESATRLADYRSDLTAEDLVSPLMLALSPVGLGDALLSPAELRAFDRRDGLKGKALSAPEPGTAAGIRSDGALEIRRPDGSLVAVKSGHVIIRV